MFDNLNGSGLDRRGFLRGSAMFATAIGVAVLPAFAQEPQQKPEPEKKKDEPKDPFSDGDKKDDKKHQVTAKGERIPVLALNQKLEPSAALSGVGFQIPAPQDQADWPVPGGNAEHAIFATRKLGHRCIERARVAAANCNRAAFLQQRVCDGLADPSRCAGDDGNFPAQS